MSVEVNVSGDWKRVADLPGQLKVHTIMADSNYEFTDADGVEILFFDPNGAARHVTLPSAPENLGRAIKIVKTSAFSVTDVVRVKGRSSPSQEYIRNTMGRDYAQFDLWQQGDVLQVISDGTRWQKLNPGEWKSIADPATGWKDTHTSWAAADNFATANKVSNFSADVPAGSCFVKIVAGSGAAVTAYYCRPDGDTNVSNTPDSNGEHAFVLLYETNNGRRQRELRMSLDYKVQFTPIASGSPQLLISYPYAYWQ
jgi:hypothetical protein